MVNLGSLWISLAIGFILSGAVAGVALRRAALSRGGFIAALAVGAVTFGLGGPAWGIVLVGFFVSSSLLSQLGTARKREASREQAKGSRRDAWQVLANGGLGALLAVLSYWSSAGWAFPAFVGSVAAVTADTWATEIGTLGSPWPRLITSGRLVAPGTSGAVSLLGTAATVLGAGFIGFVALGLSGTHLAATSTIAPVWVLIGAMSGGIVGSLADSLAGATVQATYYCESCRIGTEKVIHRCGTRTVSLKGMRWVNNDVVNFASAALGAAVGAGIWLIGSN